MKRDREGKRKTERVCVCLKRECVCVFERERDKKGNIETSRETERERVRDITRPISPPHRITPSYSTITR